MNLPRLTIENCMTEDKDGETTARIQTQQIIDRANLIH